MDATNALDYDATKGAAFQTSTYLARLVNVGANYTTVERLQFKSTASTDGIVTNISNKDPFTIKNVIIKGTHANQQAVLIFNSSNRLINSLLIASITTNILLRIGNSAQAYNCTIVKPDDVATGGTAVMFIHANNGVLKNCAVFGDWGTFFGGSAHADSGYNATSHSSAPGSNNQVSKTYANQFEDITGAAVDYRVKSGSDLVNGTRDQTNTADKDIIEQDRDTTTPTIGAWEFIAAAAAIVPLRSLMGLGT